MPVIHVYKTNHDFRRDARLSYKARGILAYIMSHEHKWEVHVETLVKDSDEDGRIAVQSALQELLKWKYAILETVRDIHGKVRGKQYVIYDVPLDIQPHRQAQNLHVGTDAHENRQSGNQSVGTDKQVPRQSGNLLVGQQESDVDASPHRQAGFPSDGFPDSQETCSTKTQDLKTKTQTQDPPISPQGEDVVTEGTPQAQSSPPTPQRTQAPKEKRPKRYMPKEETAQHALATSILDTKFETWRLDNFPEVNAEAQWVYFMNYCLANAKPYADFRAAFMNSFTWENSPAQKPAGHSHGTRPPSFAEEREQRRQERRDWFLGERDARPAGPHRLQHGSGALRDDLHD